MKRRRRQYYYSASERTLIWERWRRGETLHQIARLFDRYHSSIQGIVAETGGIRPPERRRSKLALTLTEREEISRGVVAGSSIRSIALSLGRAPSTISARSDAMAAAQAIEPVEPTRQLGIELIDRRSVNWYRTGR